MNLNGPSLKVVARLYSQNGYRRASVKPGPGEALVLLSEAAEWRQIAELRQQAFEDMLKSRDMAWAEVARLKSLPIVA